jgi:hypothetical protein
VDLYTIMTEIKTRLSAVPNLRTVEIGWGEIVSPPAAKIYLPETIRFDTTYGRGVDVYDDLAVVVFVALTNPRSALKTLAPFMAGSGAQSIKAAIDTASGAYASAHDVQVVTAEIDQTKLAGTDYLAGLFHLQILGKGA